MTLEQCVVWLVVGAIAGWIAGLIVKGSGFGFVVDVLVGIAGAFIGGWLASVIGISVGSGFVSSVIVAIGGAVVLLFVLRLLRWA
ncbi:GlsB/YeaQ/YmgE family stress response membrane protein [Burkholderia sp. BE17]|uniref:GlsB/YeaQ/YmgE family stress response membrane protein n=1 Tax=Burkholderia sp. BE17 TaxID=2656644 RepID=UPI00128CC123|nr:GlsB/YeaQ/YmgE family stress response membrane protein [Burkholderia sp. BE17]MPV71154.1 GlsB/YeaQ/YmgE family stress response membrane protein [Burkholderia sp. BE17]